MDDTVLVLDALGVIYTAADDVAELLAPYVVENGGNAAAIADHYTPLSLGQMDAADFWHAVQVSPDAEDAYLARHRLTNGLLTFLDNVPQCISSMWCLSNDVAESHGVAPELVREGSSIGSQGPPNQRSCRSTIAAARELGMPVDAEAKISNTWDGILAGIERLI